MDASPLHPQHPTWNQKGLGGGNCVGRGEGRERGSRDPAAHARPRGWQDSASWAPYGGASLSGTPVWSAGQDDVLFLESETLDPQEAQDPASLGHMFPPNSTICHYVLGTIQRTTSPTKMGTDGAPLPRGAPGLTQRAHRNHAASVRPAFCLWAHFCRGQSCELCHSSRSLLMPRRPHTSVLTQGIYRNVQPSPW